MDIKRRGGLEALSVTSLLEPQEQIYSISEVRDIGSTTVMIDVGVGMAQDSIRKQ